MGGPANFEYANYSVSPAGAVELPLKRKFEFILIGLVFMFFGWCPGTFGAWIRNKLIFLIRGHAAGPTEEDIQRTSATALFECTGSGGATGCVRFKVGDMYQWTSQAAVQGALCIIQDYGNLPRKQGCASPVAAFGDV